MWASGSRSESGNGDFLRVPVYVPLSKYLELQPDGQPGEVGHLILAGIPQDHARLRELVPPAGRGKPAGSVVRRHGRVWNVVSTSLACGR